DGHLLSRGGAILRDMDADRFAFLHGQLWSEDGVNKTASLDGRSAVRTTSYPQNVLSRHIAPQIFLGGEVDAMPEIEGGSSPLTRFNMAGDGPLFDLVNLCGGWSGPANRCPQDQTVQQDFGVTILKDVQGFDAIHPARVHMVYMPRDPNNTNGFVAS